MVKKNNIKSHFSNKAKNYHYKSLTFPWSLIRKNESRIILNAIDPSEVLRIIRIDRLIKMIIPITL